MSMKILRIGRTALMAAAIGFGVGCSEQPSDENTDQEAMHEQLVACSSTNSATTAIHGWWNGHVPWWTKPDSSGVKYPIKICWVHARALPPVNGITPGYVTTHGATDTTTENRVLNALQATWPAQSGIVIQNQGDCPSKGGALTDSAFETLLGDTAHLNWVPIGLLVTLDANGNVVAGKNGWGLGGPGYGNRNKALTDPTNPDYTYYHMRHSWWQIMLGIDTTDPGLEGFAVHEFGHVLGWEHEFARSDYQANYNQGDAKCHFNPTDSKYLNPFFTPADADSIMAASQCSAMRHDSPDPFQLSFYDALGVSIAYPKSLKTQGIWGVNGFQTASGPLVRGDDTLVTDWTFAGALDDVYKGWPTWTSGSVVATKRGMAASSLKQGVNSVSTKFNDFASRAHTGSASVTVDTSKHTALVAVTISLNS